MTLFMKAPVAALALVICCVNAVTGARIDIINKCTFRITAYRLQGSPSKRQEFPLRPGASKSVDIGQTNANLVWASSANNINQGQASALEITVNGDGGQDFYDISLVNAYNLPTKIKPIDIPAGAAVGGLQCGAPSCTIANPAGFCKPPNKYGSFGGNYGEYCINPAGPALTPSKGTKAFKKRCPNAYSYSKDDATSLYACKTGGNYQFIYCP